MSGLALTPAVAFEILAGAPSPQREAAMRAYLESRTSEELAEWITQATYVMTKRHPKAASAIPGQVLDIVRTTRAAMGAATS
jgi:hypothetical protein